MDPSSEDRDAIGMDTPLTEAILADTKLWQLVPARHFRALRKRLAALEKDYILAGLHMLSSPELSFSSMQALEKQLRRMERLERVMRSLPDVDTGKGSDLDGVLERLWAAKSSLVAVDAYRAWITQDLSRGAKRLAKVISSTEECILSSSITGTFMS